MKALVALLPFGLVACAAMSAEDVGRFLFPNRVYVEHTTGDYASKRNIDAELITFGGEWDLMPMDVRIRSDDRAWYEKQHPQAAPQPGAMEEYGPLATALATLVLGGGATAGAVRYRRRKPPEQPPT